MTRHDSQAEGPEGAMRAISKDNLAIDVDATYSWILNPDYAPIVCRKIGGDEVYERNLVYPTSAEAVRNATIEFTGEEAYASRRTEYERRITEEFQIAIVRQLREIPEFSGMSEESLQTVIKVMPTSLRRVMPPEQVLAAIERKVTAGQELLRQETLVDVAKMRARAQGNDGDSVNQFFTSLPSGTTPSEGIDYYNAFSQRIQVDALRDALEKGNIQVVYLGTGNNSVAVK
jgi:regulator of protease activity HflC (stomatin/prohibitin superfamily)